MKKLVLSIIAMYCFNIANAQDEITVSPILSSKGENYLPQIDDWAISFNANGVFNYLGNAFHGDTRNDAPTVGYVEGNTNTFVGKKFISDKKAYRVVLNLGFGANSETIPDIATGDFTTEYKYTNLDLAFGLGKEWRKGNTRLQGFYGADALILTGFNNSESTATVNEDGSLIQKVEYKSGLDLGAGIQGFLGAEYFIFPKFALGAQYTYRVGFLMNGKSETTTTDAAGVSQTVDGGKSFSFALGDLRSNQNVGFGIASINLTLYF